MPGDSVYWRGEWAIVAWLAPPDRAVISIPVPEWKWKKWWKEESGKNATKALRSRA
jgi:hypothetical protein